MRQEVSKAIEKIQAYMAAMLARRACAVQMLEVAFSLRMCCSRVWSDMRNATSPVISFETPMIRPGMFLEYTKPW